MEDAVPEYIMLEWKHRACGNKCLWTFYRIMRVCLVSFWFYFFPFVILAFNFIVPYFVEADKDVVVDGSSMGEDYEAWLAGVLEEAQENYVEPTVSELIELMKAVPLEESDEFGDWVQYMDLQVLPLKID